MVFMPCSEPENTPQATRVRIGKDGGLSIPATFRKALGLKGGDEVILHWKDDELRITPMKRRMEWTQRRREAKCK